MSSWRETSPVPKSLSSHEGELISVRAQVEARLLEALLEALAEIPYPINPEICHLAGAGGSVVEFPAYATWLDEIHGALERAGFPARTLETRNMLAALQAG